MFDDFVVFYVEDVDYCFVVIVWLFGCMYV